MNEVGHQALQDHLPIDKETEDGYETCESYKTCESYEVCDGVVTTSFSLEEKMAIPFCQPCQKARASPEYDRRFVQLQNPLHCSMCAQKHSAVYFSATQRKAPESIRKCIGHQGKCVVCPHVEFSLADIQEWGRKRRGETSEMKCPEPTCPYAQASVIHVRDKKYHRIEGSWKASVDTDQGVDFVEACLAKLQDIHKACPAAFCPHLQTTLTRLESLDSLEQGSFGESKSWDSSVFCVVCNMHIVFDQEEQTTRESDRWFKSQCYAIRHRFSIKIERNCSMDTDWIKLLDPESYGHFDDEETKHITWCDDRDCATSCELLRHDSFISLFSTLADSSLDRYTKDPMRAIENLDKLSNDGIKKVRDSLD